MKVTSPRILLGWLGLLAVGLLVSGLVLEHAFGVLPCPMCWWQRYAHLAIAVAAGLGWWFNRPRLGGGGIALAALAGLSIAAWQVAAQQGWLPYPPSCHGAGTTLVAGADLIRAMAATRIIPCDVETFRLFGLSLAAWNIPAMLLVLGGGIQLCLTKK
jgi:disulfide bond formation protein DsbB